MHVSLVMRSLSLSFNRLNWLLLESGGPFIDQVYVLQGYAEGWKEGTWEEKVDQRPCIDKLMYSEDKNGYYRYTDYNVTFLLTLLLYATKIIVWWILLTASQGHLDHSSFCIYQSCICSQVKCIVFITKRAQTTLMWTFQSFTSFHA